MKVSQCNNTNPNFGMKFSFIKQSPKGNWQKAETCFIDEVQLAIIRKKVEALKPQTDEFILHLDLPTFKVEKDSQNRLLLNNAYNMNVYLKNEKGEITTFDLGDKDIKLSLFNDKETMISHPKGPFSKLWEFVDNLANKKNQA